MEHTSCKRCGRKLISAKAIIAGMGYKCKVKWEMEKVRVQLPFECDPKNEGELG